VISVDGKVISGNHRNEYNKKYHYAV